MMYAWIIGIVILLLVIWIFSFSRYKYRERKRSRRDSPLGLLKKRFASGEISKEEFDKQRKVLEE